MQRSSSERSIRRTSLHPLLREARYISRIIRESAREIVKTIVDKGHASSEDLNLYAWFALGLPMPIDLEAIETAIRAADLSKTSFAIEHTLGCV